MKLAASLFIALLWPISNSALAQSFDHQVKVNVINTGDIFEINASFKTPLNNCDAYRYLTDYAAAKKFLAFLNPRKHVNQKQSPSSIAPLRNLFYFSRLPSKQPSNTPNSLLEA